ncbi:MAG TPA: hypothetical protein EYG85_00460 [Crocinitomix sp.]|nr:hypothetical protein [Crocinitomix sp.]
MGIGFVILIHFVVIFILSCIIAFISGLLTYFISNKDKKKRKIFLAIITPFQALYSFYIILLIGGIFISETKNVDIGIGDSWYVPINNTCRILMIDLPEQAYLECNGSTLFSEVSHLQLLDDKVYGKTFKDEYFSLNLTNNISQTYTSENELKTEENITTLKLQKTEKFYADRKWEITKVASILTLIVSVILTVLGVFIFCRLVLYGWKLGFGKKKTTTNTVYSK